MPGHPVSRGWFGLLLFAGMAFLAGATPAGQQAPPPADHAAADAVARPISPGAVALLLRHGGQPTAIERLAQALADPRPDVRAVAARVAFTIRQTALIPALSGALTREQSPLAAAEIVRALALLQGAAADGAIREVLRRFDSRAATAWLQTVSRTRPDGVWTLIDDLSADLEVGRILAARAAAQPAAAAAAFSTLRSSSARLPAFLATVRAARIDEHALPWPVLKAGLDAGGVAKFATVHLIVRLRVLDVDLPREAAAYETDLHAPAASREIGWLPLYFDLAGRRKRVERSHAESIAGLDPASLPDGLLQDPLLGRLDASETAAFAKVAGPLWRRRELPVRSSFSVPFYGPSARRFEPSGSVTRQARPVTTSLLKDLLQLTGCRPVSGQIGLMSVTYRSTGQVRGVSTAGESTGNSRPECRAVASAIAALDTAPGADTVPDSRTDRLVVGLRPSDVECERIAGFEPSLVGASEVIDWPKKLREVPPVYPTAALAARVSGNLLVESVLSMTGCVADAVVSRRLDPALDVAAIAAVSEWRYAPAVRDGGTVPAELAVTLSFGFTQ